MVSRKWIVLALVVVVGSCGPRVDIAPEEGPPVVLEPGKPLDSDDGDEAETMTAENLYWSVGGDRVIGDYSVFDTCALPVELLGLENTKVRNAWFEENDGTTNNGVQKVKLKNDAITVVVSLRHVAAQGKRSIEWMITDLTGDPEKKPCKPVALPAGSDLTFPYELYGRSEADGVSAFNTGQLFSGNNSDKPGRRFGFRVLVPM